MSALDILRSFAEAHEADHVPLPDGALSWGNARELLVDLHVLTMQRDDAEASEAAEKAKREAAEHELKLAQGRVSEVASELLTARERIEELEAELAEARFLLDRDAWWAEKFERIEALQKQLMAAVEKQSDGALTKRIADLQTVARSWEQECAVNQAVIDHASALLERVEQWGSRRGVLSQELLDDARLFLGPKRCSACKIGGCCNVHGEEKGPDHA